MKYGELLKKLRATAEAKLSRLDAIMKARNERDDPTATAEETTEIAELRTALDSLENDIRETDLLSRRALAEAQEIETDVTRGAPALAPPQGNGTNYTSFAPKPEKGIGFARLCIAMIRARNNPAVALKVYEEEKNRSGWGSTPQIEPLLRAAVAAGTTTDSAWAAPLVNLNILSSEFIDMVRAETILGRMTGFRRVPFNVKMPRKLTGGVATWVGEGLSKPVGALSFDTVTVPFAKMAGICVFTDELMRFSNPSIEALVRDDLRETIVSLMDTTFIDNTAASATRPAGLQNIVQAANEFNSTGSTVALVTADLSDALQRATAGGNKLANPYWIMSPRTAMYLSLLRTTQDIFAFREEMSRGSLLGIPVITSSHVPTNLGGGTQTWIALVSAGELFVADDGDVSIDASNQASLQLDDAPATPPTPVVSLWQQNMIAVKAERYMYWMARRVVPHSWIAAVTY